MVLVVDRPSAEDRSAGFSDSVIVGYQLPRVPLLLRIKLGIFYIFGINPISHWSEMVIEPENAKKIVNVFSRIIRE